MSSISSTIFIQWFYYCSIYLQRGDSSAYGAYGNYSLGRNSTSG